jgi:ABC-type Mn2+/Zn2+ transport system permease subunit
VSDLLDAWGLFASSWLCAWLLAPALGLVGIALVARGAVFQGVATAQASTAAIALLLVAAAWLPVDLTPDILAMVAMLVAVATAVVTCLRPLSEAGNALLFLGAGAATPLLLAHSPHGLAEVHRLMASSLVGAGWSEVAATGTVLTLLIAVVWRHGRTLRLVLMDHRFATDLGVRVRHWQHLIGIATGVVMGLGLEIAGLLFVAGCLVLPTLAARHLAGTVAGVVWLAPLIAAVAGVLATALGHLADLPPGQVVVALLALAAVLARPLGGMLLRRR